MLRRYASYYVTTPIYYVNSSPHIGHVHTSILADAVNRFQRLKTCHNDTIYSSGVDEHGIKVQIAAEKAGLEYQTYCDTFCEQFFRVFKLYNTTLTDFVRTSSVDHKKVVNEVWRKLEMNGFIYKSNYSGWYCNSDETFVPESHVTTELAGDKKIHLDQNNNQVNWFSEDNYMFQFSCFKNDILEWLSRERPIIPKRFNDEAIMMLNGIDGDLSISRPRSRLKWGIEVPNDKEQTIYVWLDALTNYLTVAGYPTGNDELRRWPIDCQIFGKDILKFHALYWPSFLMALSLPLPRRLICHSHWLADSRKISKSRGNIIDPFEENKYLTPTGLRYFLLRSGVLHADTDYKRIHAIHRVNSELADTLGGLFNRSCSRSVNPSRIIPTSLSRNPVTDIVELESRLIGVAEECDRSFSDGRFHAGIESIMSLLRLNHQIYERLRPWKLTESPNSLYNDIQAITFETLRVCSILLQPIVPDLADRILNTLNVDQRSWASASSGLRVEGSPTRSIDETSLSPLFPRLKVPSV